MSASKQEPTGERFVKPGVFVSEVFTCPPDKRFDTPISAIIDQVSILNGKYETSLEETLGVTPAPPEPEDWTSWFLGPWEDISP